MKKLTIFLLALSLVLVIGCGKSEKTNFSFSPDKPQAGQEITVKYSARNTVLKDADSVEMLAYQFFGPDLPLVEGVEMTKSGSSWRASFTPVDSALLIVVNFRSGHTVDNNERAGYFIELYDENGEVVAGSKGCKAYVFYTGAYPADIKRDRPKALELLNEEFSSHPQQRESFLRIYLELVMRTDREKGMEKVKAILDSIDALPEISLKNKELLASWYGRIGDNEKSDKYYQQILKENPNNPMAEMKKFREFRSLKSTKEKVKFYKKFIKEFPESNYAGYMASIILRDFTEKKQFDQAENFIDNIIPEPTSMMYNSLAWSMVEQGINLRSAADIARKGVELARERINAPISEKPSYLTEKDWREQLKNSLGPILDTYGYALYKLGKKAEAVPVLEEAVELTKKKEGDINQRYVTALLETGNNEKALEIMKELLSEGNGFAGIDEKFKTAYAAVNGSEEGVEKLLFELKNKGKEKQIAELKKEMISDKPAPEFSLTDLAGDTVSLKDFQGKVVVLDFWATWCGPCKASFPGMQKVVDKFKDDEDVKFLFVNTWERGENVKEKVAKFIKDNNYTFHVLLDLDSEVVSKYGVEGIPTKFVVDKNGNIRFKSVGYSGSAQKLVDELSLMIEMLK